MESWYSRDIVSYIDRLPHELIYKILLPMSHDDIIAYCGVSKSANIICSDYTFWMEKLNLKLSYINGDGVRILASDYVRNFGHHDQSGLKIYKRWIMGGTDIIPYVKGGYNDMVIWLLNKYRVSNKSIYKYIVDMSVESNNMEILLWFEERNILPSISGANHAAENGNIEMLEWLERRNILLKSYGVNKASQNGHINVLFWAEKRGIQPDSGSAEYAADGGHMDILEYLESKGDSSYIIRCHRCCCKWAYSSIRMVRDKKYSSK